MSRNSVGQVWAVLTAAGSGSRLGASDPKALVRSHGRSLLSLALERLLQVGDIAGVIVTCPPGEEQRFAADCEDVAVTSTPVPIHFIAGGSSRQASVSRGLDALATCASDGDVVLVHDAARCLAPTSLMEQLVIEVRSGREAVIPGLPVTDTIKQVSPDGAGGEVVVATPSRMTLRIAQTPQAFRWDTLRKAHLSDARRAASEATAATDDAELVEEWGADVSVIPGSPLAFKVTTGEDLRTLDQTLTTILATQ